MAEAHALAAVRFTALVGVVGVVLGACTSTIDGTGPAGTGGTNGTSSGAVGAANTCPGRSGSYRVILTRVAGDCGEFEALSFVAEGCQQVFCIPYSNANVPGTSTEVGRVFPACAGTVDVPSDNCSATFDYRCISNEDASGIDVSGDHTWSPTGDGGNGSTTMISYGPGGQVLCRGTYEVVITKL